MPASLWNVPNWMNWYWWLPDNGVDEIVDADLPEESNQNEEIIEKEEPIQKEEELISKEEIKPKRKKRTSRKKVSTKPEEGLQLILRPSILEELEKEAQGTDTTLNQLIQVILEAHLETKDDNPLELEPWKCTFCEPQEEFSDYFKYSEHFFAQHMQPDLQKLSDVNQVNQ